MVNMVLLCASLAFASSNPINSPGLKQKLSTLSSEYVLLQVWSPFCEPCAEEVREINDALSKTNQNSQKLMALGIPVQSRDREIHAFVDYFQPHYEQWIPDHDFNEAFSKEGAVPWTWLLGRDRRLLHEWRGKVSSKQIIAVLAEASRRQKP